MRAEATADRTNTTTNRITLPTLNRTSTTVSIILLLSYDLVPTRTIVHVTPANHRKNFCSFGKKLSLFATWKFFQVTWTNSCFFPFWEKFCPFPVKANANWSSGLTWDSRLGIGSFFDILSKILDILSKTPADDMSWTIVALLATKFPLCLTKNFSYFKKKFSFFFGKWKFFFSMAKTH